MRMLVFNCGSSSLTYKIFDFSRPDQARRILGGKAYRVGVKGTRASYIEHHFHGHTEKSFLPIPDHRTAAMLVSDFVKKNHIRVDRIGHRFVHGGVFFKKPVILNKNNLGKLKLCLPLAPLHNPIAMSVIEESMRLFPEVRQFAVFDNVFHSTIPWWSYEYAIPAIVRERYQLRKYGFHGLSYAYISREVPDFLKAGRRKLKMIICHLGTGGASIAAIDHGVSRDTSMGFSPLSGLVMSTRSGDIDPALVFQLMKREKFSPEDLNNLLNKKSGLLGLSGFSSDITDIIRRLSYSNKRSRGRARLALNIYLHRIRKYIGSYLFALGGKINALVFTDDIGVHCPFVRREVCRQMEWAGIDLDPVRNKRSTGNGISEISSRASAVRVLSVATEEEFMIGLEGARFLGGGE